ncbi:regulatory LuxR family protein [Lutibacter sp. Hel_I_33_5]|uniref:triple tyrosine motif-containing protein n=1 Tax=Lutibacter sp. Hel_I_33_5 TaxID=1566289 RepID=UPI0011A09C36|nr:triple tyrosine motif-containing protein [Lutibacter sp. Hel_I_33_5]TVZ57217.1 regulatory LuxR family protein [Lutibacter sp. Hel_I_33_5]
MKFIKSTFTVLLFFVLSINIAQELPPINTFTPEDYRAESQNWSISQSNDGFLYVVNNQGLLEFDGVNWKLFPTPNETIMRSVKVVGDKIYTGFYMDFGFWKKDELGELHYTSLIEKANITPDEDEQFWNIIKMNDWMLFQSLKRIYLYNDKTNQFKIIESKTKITKIIQIDNTIYFQKINKGVFKIEKGEGVLVSDHDVFKENEIISIYQENENLFFITDTKGFFKLNNSRLTKIELPFYNSFMNATIYSAQQLSNGGFILGTISHGAYYINKEGELIYNLNYKNGLTNNTVLSVFEDDRKNIWLGLDNGINSINIDSPFRIYNDKNGNIGTVYDSKIHNGNLYLGTNQGLFYKKYPSNNELKFIENTQGQVWSLKKFDDKLFCGHNAGTFIINDDKVTVISTINGTWDLKKIADDKILQGNYDGLHILEKENSEWKYSHRIKGFDNSSRYFELYKDDLIFVNHEYKGVFKLKVNKSYDEILSFERDTTISKGLHSGLIKYKGDIVYSYKNGVYKFDGNKNKFLKDSFLSKLIPKENFISGKLVFDTKENLLFGFANENINYLTSEEISNNPIIKQVSISENFKKGAIGFENFNKLSESNYLFGTLDGYTLFNLDKVKNHNYTIKISGVKKNSLDAKPIILPLGYENENIDLDAEENNIQFKYNVPYFGQELNVKFQYKLIGQSENWSNWSTEPQVLFKNLSFGDYTFKVRGKVGNSITENVANYNFSIKRPWYLSNLALVLYIISFIIFSILMHTIYKRYYSKQREALLLKQEKEFKLKSLANEKELMKIKNDQLRLDVNGKNRELAISTMSLLKKNEFLSLIKTELKDVENRKAYDVVRLIDKNLNNTDDWEMFKEAFNNADKDFIKKLKTSHPNLTPNDLRLCAYLRLNLSSKEIAPLLNISPRSVEVKRYRLRKKMSLPHDANLTDYILEI